MAFQRRPLLLASLDVKDADATASWTSLTSIAATSWVRNNWDTVSKVKTFFRNFQFLNMQSAKINWAGWVYFVLLAMSIIIHVPPTNSLPWVAPCGSDTTEFMSMGKRFESILHTAFNFFCARSVHLKPKTSDLVVLQAPMNRTSAGPQEMDWMDQLPSSPAAVAISNVHKLQSLLPFPAGPGDLLKNSKSHYYGQEQCMCGRITCHHLLRAAKSLVLNTATIPASLAATRSCPSGEKDWNTIKNQYDVSSC